MRNSGEVKSMMKWDPVSRSWCTYRCEEWKEAPKGCRQRWLISMLWRWPVWDKIANTSFGFWKRKPNNFTRWSVEWHCPHILRFRVEVEPENSNGRSVGKDCP